MVKEETSYWWWFDSHQTSKRSEWLQSTLGELEKKTKAMLKLIEEDADSFSQRAEMYYKKRPELISMVENFYKEHRSLAEQYDHLKSEPGRRVLTTVGSLFSAKYQLDKLTTAKDLELQDERKVDDSAGSEVDNQSEISDPEESAESEVDDPEQHDGIEAEEDLGEIEEPEEKGEPQVDEERSENEAFNDELVELKREVEKLQEENRIQKDQLLQKDEEKREVIRQLSLAMETLKEENMKLRKCVAKKSPKKKNHSAVQLWDVVLGKLFNGVSKV